MFKFQALNFYSITPRLKPSSVALNPMK